MTMREHIEAIRKAIRGDILAPGDYLHAVNDAFNAAIEAADERDKEFERLTAELEERKQVAVAFAEKDAMAYAKYLVARVAWTKLSPLVSIMSAIDIEQANILDAYFNPAKEG